MKKFLKGFAATLLITTVIGAGVVNTNSNKLNTNKVTINSNMGSIGGLYTS